MHRLFYTLIIALLAMSCNSGQQNSSKEGEQLPFGTHKGEVNDVIQTASYTYLLVKENGVENWIAIPQAAVEKGKTVYYDEGLEMKNFESKSLGRIFETVYFVSGIRDEAVKPINQAIQDNLNKKTAVSKSDISIEQPNGAQSIASIFEKRDDFSKQQVSVRGQIVKVNNNILGTNWVHIQDGSNFNGDFDLTVTTKELCKVGDVVTFMGTIALNQDFGAGYTYEVIMEEAVKVIDN